MAILRCLSIRKIWYLVELENKTAIGIGLWRVNGLRDVVIKDQKRMYWGTKTIKIFPFCGGKSVGPIIASTDDPQSFVFGSSGYVYVKKGV